MTPVARALHEAASAIRALSDGELVALALKASEAGALPPTIGRGEEHAPPASNRRASSRRAEAPKSPALSEAGEPASARPRVRHGADKHRAVVLETMKTRPRWSLRTLAGKVPLGHWTLSRTIHALVREGTVLASGATNSREFRLP